MMITLLVLLKGGTCVLWESSLFDLGRLLDLITALWVSYHSSMFGVPMMSARWPGIPCWANAGICPCLHLPTLW